MNLKYTEVHVLPISVVGNLVGELGLGNCDPLRDKRTL